ncbi:alpha-1,3/1,6-mannosyltransferase ALG2 [Mycotypha africana]|uniref:alpha-1,3/1,6-mannosyltransferase ALG2 n=1 Tax=Mycotypha africana TaxID=64632 RepID=UPI002300B1F2|nr:alpha-1,3/1,6-mannosyltransferase ALG2 [Mycotypha africana]KAI8977405.1 alpha-1,3/1,6-mannosyltransferase ALG2 [Mycotypha africana]
MSKGNAPLKVAFVHPDLGIGGAERLVVDAAMGIQSKGHIVTMYTSHHDPNHCFDETRNGMLRVCVIGNFLPRSLFGRFYIVFAVLRQLALVIWLLFHEKNTYDVIFLDQLSSCIPLLKWFSSTKVLFYGHFPDAFLSKRESILKKLYRLPFDKMEEVTTNMADTIAVNSQFSASMFNKAFSSGLKQATVLYPPINFACYDNSVDMSDPTVKLIETNKKIIVSINRFERKKNIELALRAFALLEKNNLLPKDDFQQNYRLVLAGGYDKRVVENVEYLKELDTLATKIFGLKTFTIYPSPGIQQQHVPEDAQVVFLCSFNDAQRTYLLNRSIVLLYTPSNEHFGIVPIEAMYTRLPVIATNSGGPLETVIDKVTGFNLPPEPEKWAEGIKDLTLGKYDRAKMGEVGREYVKSKFSLEAFSDQLEDMMVQLVSTPNDHHFGGPLAFILVVVFGLLSAFIYSYFQ